MSSLSEEERTIRELIEATKLDIEADNLKEAGERIRQAIKIAKNTGNEELLNHILDFVQIFTYSSKTQ